MYPGNSWAPTCVLRKLVTVGAARTDGAFSSRSSRGWRERTLVRCWSRALVILYGTTRTTTKDVPRSSRVRTVAIVREYSYRGTSSSIRSPRGDRGCAGAPPARAHVVRPRGSKSTKDTPRQTQGDHLRTPHHASVGASVYRTRRHSYRILGYRPNKSRFPVLTVDRCTKDNLTVDKFWISRNRALFKLKSARVLPRNLCGTPPWVCRTSQTHSRN